MFKIDVEILALMRERQFELSAIALPDARYNVYGCSCSAQSSHNCCN